MYELIGYGYDATRRAQPYIAQPYIAEQIARHLSLEEGRTYPDVACGTGNYSGALAAQGGSWAGVDLALRMIGQARQKTLAVHWDLDKAENSPSCAALCGRHLRSCPASFRLSPAWQALGKCRRVAHDSLWTWSRGEFWG